MPPPQAILCHLCNGKYFKHSLPIHLKKCEEKWRKTHSRCEYCGSAVANSDWGDHRSHCKPTKKKRKRTKENHNIPLEVPKSTDMQIIPTLSNKSKSKECEECESDVSCWQCIQCEQCLCAMCEISIHKKGARSRHQRIPMNAKALRSENLSIITEHDNENKELEPPSADATVDPRKQCKFCQRRFNPQRIEKHMRICSKSAKKAKKRRVYDGAKQRVLGTDFEEFMYNRSSTPPQIKEWKKHGRRWRTESNQLRGIADVKTDICERMEKLNLKKMGEHKETNDDDIEISIAVPSKKPVFKPMKKQTNNNKNRNALLQGKSAKMSRRSSATSSARSSARSSVSDNSARSYRSNRKSTRSKKPPLPTFGGNSNRLQKQARKGKVITKNNRTGSNNPSAGQSRGSSLSVNNSGSAIASSRTSSKRNSFASRNQVNNNRNKNKKNLDKSQTKIVNKENNMKIGNSEIPISNNKRSQQPIAKKTNIKVKSEANSLPRGFELGLNVNNMFDDKPTGMDDYRERERQRREKRKTGNNGNSMARPYRQKNNSSTSSYTAPPKKKKTVIGPKPKRNKFLVKQEIKINDQKIGGGPRIHKPSDQEDLAAKRAKYYKSLMQIDD